MKRTIHLIALAVLIGMLVGPTVSFALNTDFHGYLESRGVFRDTSGWQYGFMDDLQGVQWIQELQLDLEVTPEYPTGQPLVRFEKAFFRYRGAYDAIYDTSDKYNDVVNDAQGKFELGKRDLKWDQDLREAFADFVAENEYSTMRANLRLGKQIVQWGESDAFNLMNIVNPNDYYNKAFFSNPEDLLAPLWMSRLDASFPGVGIINNFNIQALVIPYFRPHVFGPVGAPYMLGLDYDHEENVNDSWFGDNTEFGLRLGAVTATSQFYLYYFDGRQDGPALDFTTAVTTLRHPETKTYGYSFNRFFETGNFVLRGEGSYTTDGTQMDLETLGTGGKGYSEHDVYQVLFGIDKSFSNLPIGTASALTTAVQVYYKKIDDYDQDDALRPAPEETWRATLVLATDYLHGSITPSMFFVYDSEDALLANIGVTYSPDAKWYFTVSTASVWGDKEGNGDYNPYIASSSEFALKVGYRW